MVWIYHLEISSIDGGSFKDLQLKKSICAQLLNSNDAIKYMMKKEAGNLELQALISKIQKESKDKINQESFYNTTDIDVLSKRRYFLNEAEIYLVSNHLANNGFRILILDS